MSQLKPSMAPSCWGSKYQDGDEECRQCDYRDTCRSAVLERSINPVTKFSLPPASPTFPPPQKPSYQIPIFPPSQPTTNISPRPYASHVQVPIKTQPPVPPVPPTYSYQHQPPSTTYQSQGYSASTGYSLPDPNKPNPAMAMHRPGAQAPAYYFTQYPGESVGERLTKNVILRGLEAIFYELTQFFRHWTWPPGGI